MISRFLGLLMLLCSGLASAGIFVPPPGVNAPEIARVSIRQGQVGGAYASPLGARVEAQSSASVLGRAISVTASRVLTPAGLRNVGLAIVKRIGPLGAATLVIGGIQLAYNAATQRTEAIEINAANCAGCGGGPYPEAGYTIDGSNWMDSAQQACAQTYQCGSSGGTIPGNVDSHGYPRACIAGSGVMQNQCTPGAVISGLSYRNPCILGNIMKSGSCVEPTRVPTSDADIAVHVAAMSAAEVPPLVVEALRLAPDALQGPLDAAPIDSVTGPSSVVGDTTTSQSGTGTSAEIRTSTPTAGITYNNSTVNVSVTTTTTTTNAGGTSTSTTIINPPSDTRSASTDFCALHPTASACLPFPVAVPGSGSGTVEQVDICVLHPEASGCGSLGTVADDVPLGAVSRPLTLVSERSAGGSCPSPYVMVLMGTPRSFSFDMICRYASGIRPFILILSTLGAGLFVFRVARG